MIVSDTYKADYWKTSKIWNGATVYVLGGGSSLLDEDLELIHNERVIGVNNAFMLGDWVDIVWWGDPRWFEWNEEDLANFGGLKACCCDIMLKVPNSGVKVLDRGCKQGLEERESYISWNWSSGGSAINLATLLGASKVVLLGFDMQPDKEGRYWWHDMHKVKSFSKEPYDHYITSFEFIRRDADRLGIELVNSTMCSRIPEEYVSKKPLEEVIEN